MRLRNSHFESRLLFLGKSTVLVVAAVILCWPLTAQVPVMVAAFATLLAAISARIFHRLGIQTRAALFVAVAVISMGNLLASLVRDSMLISGQLGSVGSLTAADAVVFFSVPLGLVFALRLLASRSRRWSVVEAGIVVASVAHLFARHRNMSIDRPRFMADWALSHGYDPQVLLLGTGVIAAGFAIAMTLRRQHIQKLALSVVALLILFGVFFGVAKDVRMNLEPEPDTMVTGKKGKQKQQAPVPVAVALFHQDHKPLNDLLYFRQQVLSHFDGRRLVVDASDRFDRDIIEVFPNNESISADAAPQTDYHLKVPTSMYLLADHPQPLALSGSANVSPRKNPNPRRFVAAYDAVSFVVNTPAHRLVGRRSIPESWTEEAVSHYTGHPDDPRYRALANALSREMDLRFDGDDVVRAFAIKAYLEREGFYTRKERHLDAEDPAASFLFGNLRGYCVHFAHATAHLLRTMNIASRVAVGYMVDNRLRGSGSAVVITSERAHAWPEIHVEGIGWLPFDIYPERSDEPPAQVVEQSLESLLGELARNDITGGRTESPEAYALNIPWPQIWRGLLSIILVFLTLGYIVKISRQLKPVFNPADHRMQFAAVLDRLSDVGAWRSAGESRERYATRLASVTPGLDQLTMLHLRMALGRPTSEDPVTLTQMCKSVLLEYDANLPRWRRILGWLNPWGWWFTR